MEVRGLRTPVFISNPVILLTAFRGYTVVNSFLPSLNLIYLFARWLGAALSIQCYYLGTSEI